MAISVAFGVLFGTLIILFYFPPLILYFNDMRRARWWLWIGGNQAPTKMEVEPVSKQLIRIGEFSDSEKDFKKESEMFESSKKEISTQQQSFYNKTEGSEKPKNFNND